MFSLLISIICTIGLIVTGGEKPKNVVEEEASVQNLKNSDTQQQERGAAYARIKNAITADNEVFSAALEEESDENFAFFLYSFLQEKDKAANWEQLGNKKYILLKRLQNIAKNWQATDHEETIKKLIFFNHFNDVLNANTSK